MNLKKMNRNWGYVVATLSIAGLAGGMAWADNQYTPFVAKGGTGTGCIGVYTGMAKMTNSTGSVWFTAPAGVTTGTFTDNSGFPPPYVSVVSVSCLTNLTPICGTNSISFPAAPGAKFELTAYVKSPVPPPTNGQPLNLQITWQ